MPPARPHVVIVVADDMGYSDLGCCGGEIATPNLDRLGRAGVRLTRFYNTTRCSPSRASLLTGLHPHQTGIGILTDDDRPDGYRGSLNERCLTIAEVLRGAGHATCLSGKWHLASEMWTPTDVSRKRRDPAGALQAGARTPAFVGALRDRRRSRRALRSGTQPARDRRRARGGLGRVGEARRRHSPGAYPGDISPRRQGRPDGLSPRPAAATAATASARRGLTAIGASVT